VLVTHSRRAAWWKDFMTANMGKGNDRFGPNTRAVIAGTTARKYPSGRLKRFQSEPMVSPLTREKLDAHASSVLTFSVKTPYNR
jgi:hypothetical protein